MLLIILVGETSPIKPAQNDFERRILNLLSKRLMSTSQVAKELGMRRDVIAGYLEALKNQGKLNFFKVGRSHVYITSERWRNE
jgi:predicted transcriptional regulator